MKSRHALITTAWLITTMVAPNIAAALSYDFAASTPQGSSQLREEITIQITETAAGNQSVEDALAKIQARAEKIHAQGDINPGQPHVSQFTR